MCLASSTRWSGFGIISPKGLFLEAISERSSYIVKLLESRPKRSRLVKVQATLTPVTRDLKVKNPRKQRPKSRKDSGFVDRWTKVIKQIR